ncbi:MAG: FAD-dependent oxidoreductase [Candidatus Eremiobacteraeota bacterium]|nr:FAD-dependent oxidoreductase [Candidatus Eremiobacteraeota bacterium]MBV8367019.1 FAD-dependent oxidoreductase [Candidatus Eremiobacteraeota bacterium]
MAARRVAVVGAGLAGLAAGLDLHDAGCEVTLYERSRLLGGRATSFVAGGHEVDNGQHVFLGCCTEFIDFVERVGMGTHLHLQERFEAVVISRSGVISRLRAGRLPAPLHMIASFAGYRHLGWNSKMRVARALAGAASAQRSSSSFGDWLAQRGQDEQALRAFWRPFFVPALNAPLDRMSAADAGFVMSTAFLANAGAARFGYSTVPLAHIAAAAAARLDFVRLETPVTGLALSARGDRALALELDGGERPQFDAVVLALPPPQLAQLLGDPARAGLSALDQYDSLPIVDVHLWHDRGSLGFDFAALLDSPIQWIFEKAPGYLCASMSAAEEYVGKPSRELIDLCWSEARALLPGLLDASLEDGAATRTPAATFMARAGTTRPGARTALDNVVVAGSWTNTGWPDTMESAVISGRSAAAAIVTQGESSVA